MINEVDEDEAEEMILKLLRENKRMTTSEVELAMRDKGLKCQDGPVRVLSKLKFKGKVQGKLSIKSRGWVWWI
ncbi:MAG: hypothetical protein JSV49_06740 [Thermoplasmata archaeon]|nr:MAG: hypothetical protein JSV49_06740 [Thermoplasmata archaeon]